ncbi:PDZ domain-containing protein [Caldalkalibacillus salinus]|uniref:PDZ domain-containing protein n=1 Tax=Caldalkalibacillus salinus TaxID=2803787 RepID=UPI001922E347|nr:PDZ domain-containing protein [Caldalkalibacillus salinus]
MEVWMQWITAMWYGIPAFFINPFPYLLLLIICMQWKRQVDMERKLFSARLHTVSEGVLQSVFYGILGGLLASSAFIGLGVIFSMDTFIALWIVALVLMLFQVRYLCFAYSGAIVGLFALIATWFPQGLEVTWLQPLWTILLDIHIPSLFAIVGILHLAEALLIYLNGANRATPVFIQSKRGRIVGAYHIQQIWFVPVFAVFGASDGLPSLFEGWPLLQTSVGWTSYSLLLLPAVLGFSEQAISSTPQQKANTNAKYLFFYSMALLALVFGAVYLSEWFLVLAALFSFLGHEAILFYSRWKEQEVAPTFVHTNDGLRILAVIPGTPAERMGLKIGELIYKVNGQRVHERKDLYEAMQSNMAFCKLEVIDEQSMIRFAKSSIYEEDHHQLGIILAPDEEVPFYMGRQDVSLGQLLRNRLLKKTVKYSTTDIEKPHDPLNEHTNDIVSR